MGMLGILECLLNPEHTNFPKDKYNIIPYYSHVSATQPVKTGVNKQLNVNSTTISKKIREVKG